MVEVAHTASTKITRSMGRSEAVVTRNIRDGSRVQLRTCLLKYDPDFKVDGRERIKGAAGMVEGEDGEG